MLKPAFDVDATDPIVVAAWVVAGAVGVKLGIVNEKPVEPTAANGFVDVSDDKPKGDAAPRAPNPPVAAGTEEMPNPTVAVAVVAPAASGTNLAKGLVPNDGAGPEPNLPIALVSVPAAVAVVPVLVAVVAVAGAVGVELAISPLPLPLPIDGNLGVLLPLIVEIKQQSSISQSLNQSINQASNQAIKYQINKSPTKEQGQSRNKWRKDAGGMWLFP
jgi:hypothetical protein